MKLENAFSSVHVGEDFFIAGGVEHSILRSVANLRKIKPNGHIIELNKMPQKKNAFGMTYCVSQHSLFTLGGFSF